MFYYFNSMWTTMFLSILMLKAVGIPFCETFFLLRVKLRLHSSSLLQTVLYPVHAYGVTHPPIDRAETFRHT